MVIINKKKLFNFILWSAIMLVIAVIWLVISVLLKGELLVSSYSIFEILLFWVLVGMGSSGVVNMLILDLRYRKYFKQEAETTIVEIANELKLSKLRVRRDIEFFAKKVDRNNVKNAEYIKFKLG